jgi:YHS domain-containing protein
MSMTKLLDPICDMVVDVADARDQGLTLERPEREYAFCSQGCLVKFAKSPGQYVANVEAWLAAGATNDDHPKHMHAEDLPVIDQGMREWYKACRCCLSESYPKVVEVLDAEKAAT